MEEPITPVSVAMEVELTPPYSETSDQVIHADLNAPEAPMDCSDSYSCDPAGMIKDRLEEFLLELLKVKESWPFQLPVDPVLAPNYHQWIKHPMDLQTMRIKLKDGMF